jgi:predicted permease
MMTNLRMAARALRKNARFSAGVTLIMAVAIGANTAMFSVYDRLVLHPVSIPDPSSLIAIWFNNPQRNVQTPSCSIPRYEELGQRTQSFSSLGLSAFDNFTLTGNGEPAQLNGLRVSSTFFPTLGILPRYGRNFTAQEDVANGPAVAIISHELWQSQFGGRTVIGQTIQLNGTAWEVVGIMPPALSAPFGQVQVFAPRVFEVAGLTAAQIQSGATYAQPIARLKPGVSLEQARAELVAFSSGYHERYPSRLDADNVSEPRPFVSALVSGFEPTMYTLLGAVACVLLIACANVASLFLSRLLARRKEIAVRLSIGATRAAIVRQFLAESLLFSIGGALLGTLLAVWTLSVLQSVISSQVPPNTVLRLNWRVLLFTGAITLVSAVLTGLLPALQASRADLAEQLKDGARGTSGAQGRRFRHGLIVAEVMLSVVLLVGAALLLASFVKLQNTAPGFDPGGAAAAYVGLAPGRYATAVPQLEFYDQVAARLRAQPAITGAAIALSAPLSGFSPRTVFGVAGQPLPPLAQRRVATMNIVSDDFFSALRIPLAQGRSFTAEDRATSPPVCIVNETLAKRLFAEDGAVLGHSLLLGRDGTTRAEIVGVIRDVKSAGLNVPPPDELYLPLRQTPRPGMFVIARTSGDPSALQAAIRSAVATADKDQAISFFATLDATVTASLGAQQLVATLTGIFAALALALALIGLYSVLAYAVSQRTAEIGIRMALGASPRQVVGLVMRHGLALVTAGLVLGLAGAAGASRLIRQLLFGVQPLDAAIYGGIAVLFALVAALACIAPSRRASRIDPLTAFRAE